MEDKDTDSLIKRREDKKQIKYHFRVARGVEYRVGRGLVTRYRYICTDCHACHYEFTRWRKWLDDRGRCFGCRIDRLVRRYGAGKLAWEI
jgi:hypothetical protein